MARRGAGGGDGAGAAHLHDGDDRREDLQRRIEFVVTANRALTVLTVRYGHEELLLLSLGADSHRS